MVCTSTLGTLLVFSFASMAAADVRFRPLVLSGQPVPGAAGVTFVAGPTGAAGGYVVTASGHFMAIAHVTGGVALIAGDLRAADPMLRVLARQGAPAPGAPGATISTIGDRFSQSLDGRGVWSVQLDVSAEPETILYGEATIGDLPTVIARQGEPVSGLPQGVRFGTLSAPQTSVVSGGNGVFVFAGRLEGDGVAPDNDTAIWRGMLDAPGELALIAREGDPVPGQLSSRVYGDLAGSAPAVGPSGEVFVVGPSDQGAGLQAILRFPSGSRTPEFIVRALQRVDGFIPNSFVAESLAISSSGRLGFLADFPNASLLLYVGDPINVGSFRLAARPGQSVPGSTPITIRNPISFRLGDDNRVSFIATLSGDVAPSSDSALVTQLPASYATISREGTASPVLPAGEFFSSWGQPFGRDARGQTITLATIGGVTVTPASDRALVLADAAGAPTIVAREGQPIQVAPGDQRIVAELDAAAATRMASFSGRSEFLVQVRFGDNSRGILLGEVLSCVADFNRDGERSLQDLFDFLQAWFAHQPAADINHLDGLTPQDIAEFLSSWFMGCP